VTAPPPDLRPSPPRHFAVRARAITYAALVTAVVVVVGGAIATVNLWRPGSGVVVGYVVAVATLAVLLVGLGIIATRSSRALQALAAAHPADVVFLARRLPPVVSDLPSFLKAKGIDAQITDGWYPATAHSGGLTVWTMAREPHEVLTIEWSEIGDVLAVRAPTVSGDAPWGVTVDVKPYVIPLTVVLGYAWGIATMSLDEADTADVVAAVLARRP